MQSKNLKNQVLKEWTNLKLGVIQLKKENNHLTKNNLLLTLISLGLVCWLAMEVN